MRGSESDPYGFLFYSRRVFSQTYRRHIHTVASRSWSRVGRVSVHVASVSGTAVASGSAVSRRTRAVACWSECRACQTPHADRIENEIVPSIRSKSIHTHGHAIKQPRLSACGARAARACAHTMPRIAAWTPATSSGYPVGIPLARPRASSEATGRQNPCTTGRQMLSTLSRILSRL